MIVDYGIAQYELSRNLKVKEIYKLKKNIKSRMRMNDEQLIISVSKNSIHTNAQGKREAHNVYAKTKEECERLLDEMIVEVRRQIQAEKEQMKGMSL